MKKRHRRQRKAAQLAAFIYLCGLGLGTGMLRAAQETRRILYGGTPVMAQINHAESQEIMLGGGEWHIALPEIQHETALAEKLPPSMGKYLLRLFLLADYGAAYTAECIRGM